ncbi:MAG: hypothetical protein WC223_01495 [Bacteroidales bacterium]|jgi:hypothetical protein
MQIYDVCTKKVYEKDGERKVKFYKSGIMKITDSGRIYIRLFHQPEVDFHVFEKTPKLPTINSED